MDSESSQQFCLRWHNHQSSVLGGLPALLDSGRLTDVTLCAGGRSLRAHRIVLSTCSPYFMDIFKELPPSQQPVVVILGGGWAELCCLVAFMYAGEVTLPRTLLPSLLRLARALRITGLTDLNGNIPDVPMQPEFDDSFNSKFETTFTTYDDMKFSRQNSDSVGCAENISPFQKSFESPSTSKSTSSPTSKFNDPFNPQMLQENVYQEIELLKQLSKQCVTSERNNIMKDDIFNENDGRNVLNTSLMSHGKKNSRMNKPKYLNPILNELEPKNRKIDKIVENLKCNQLKSQEANSAENASTSFNFDIQNNLLNAPKVDLTEKLNQKVPSTDVPLSAGSKVADIFASNNIFMETDTENTSSDTTLENLVTNVKIEPDSSPEILPDLKYVPLSPGIQPVGPLPTNTKLYATCYVCHKRLSNQYNLRVHLETHQNARHACIACNHVSRSRDALRKHVSYRHPQLNISHGVGRPCKANQNTPSNNPVVSQSSVNTMNTSNIFNFPSTSATSSDTITNQSSKSNVKTGGNTNSQPTSVDSANNQYNNPAGTSANKSGDKNPNNL